MTRLNLKKEYNFLSNGLHCKAQVNKSDIAIKIPKVNKYREFINGFLINTGTLHYVEFSKSLHDSFFNKRVLELTSSKEFLKAPFNINIVKKEKDHIQIRTFEKGVNRETLSCGSGSTASILAVFLAFKKKYSLVKARGGNLNVDFHFNNKFFEKIRLISKPTIINSGYLSIEV
jgi:diaminopimelate epimerase